MYSHIVTLRYVARGSGRDRRQFPGPQGKIKNNARLDAQSRLDRLDHFLKNRAFRPYWLA